MEVIAPPTRPVIVAATRVTTGRVGLPARVAAESGITFAWGAQGGTLTSDPTGTTVTYTAGAPGSLVLTCTATNALGASVSGTLSVTVVATGMELVAGLPGGPGYANGTGSPVRFQGPLRTAVVSATSYFVADTENHVIRRFAGNAVTLYAGVPGVAGSDDGPSAAATFNRPSGLAYHAGTGTLYVADTGNHLIRAISATGTVSTYAGTAGVAGYLNGTDTAAQFNAPNGITLDAGDTLYVADTGNHALRRIDGTGAVTSFAGAGTPDNPGSDDGTGSAARFRSPEDLAFSPATASGYLVVADTGNHSIRKVAIGTAAVTTHSGQSGTPGLATGNSAASRFRAPRGIAIDAAELIFVADTGNHLLRTVSRTSGSSTILAGVSSGSTGVPGSADGDRTSASFNGPVGLGTSSGNTIYVVDTGNHVVRRVVDGVVTTHQGSAPHPGSSNPSPSTFRGPVGAVVLSDGTIVVADTGNHVLRSVSPAGEVADLAGQSGTAGTADGPADQARFKDPQGLAVGVGDAVYVADTGNHAVRAVTRDGTVTTVAGLAGTPGVEDGDATTTARFRSPGAVATDGADLLVADTGNHTLRVVSAGVVSTRAGQAGVAGTSDGTGSSAAFSSPAGLALDGQGLLWVADSGNHVIRTVTTAGTVATVLGGVGLPGWVDQTGTSARFHGPRGLAWDRSGNLWVTDAANGVLRMVSPVLGVSTPTGQPGVVGVLPGALAAAAFNTPTGLALSPGGDLVVTDPAENVVLLVRTSVAGRRGPCGPASPRSWRRRSFPTTRTRPGRCGSWPSCFGWPSCSWPSPRWWDSRSSSTTRRAGRWPWPACSPASWRRGRWSCGEGSPWPPWPCRARAGSSSRASTCSPAG